MRSKPKTAWTARSRAGPTTPRPVPRDWRGSEAVRRRDGTAPALTPDAPPRGLIGLAPQDDLGAMMAAQLTAAHAATMACYREAADEPSYERRRECLNQATRLMRALLALFTALQRRGAPLVRARLRPTDAAKSTKQPSGCASAEPVTSAEFAKQPSPTAAARGATHASAPAQAKFAKQPSAGLPPALASRLAHAAPGDIHQIRKTTSPAHVCARTSAARGGVQDARHQPRPGRGWWQARVSKIAE
jgi:hypothetical protein